MRVSVNTQKNNTANYNILECNLSVCLYIAYRRYDNVMCELLPHVSMVTDFIILGMVDL